MSRRRSAPQDDAKKIDFVCTGRGDHPRVKLGHVLVSPDGQITHTELGIPSIDSGEGQPAQVTHTDTGVEAVIHIRVFPTFQRPCWRCGRDFRLRIDRSLEQLCAGLSDTDKRIDLSEGLSP